MKPEQAGGASVRRRTAEGSGAQGGGQRNCRHEKERGRPRSRGTTTTYSARSLRLLIQAGGALAAGHRASGGRLGLQAGAFSYYRNSGRRGLQFDGRAHCYYSATAQVAVEVELCSASLSSWGSFVLQDSSSSAQCRLVWCSAVKSSAARSCAVHGSEAPLW